MILFSYLIFFYIIFSGFRFQKSKKVTLAFLIYFWILMGLNTGTGDYENYVIMYEEAMLSLYIDGIDPEWGYTWLNLLFNWLGFSYQEFRMFYGALYAFLAISMAKRFSEHPNYVLSYMLIWPFLCFISGQRQAMASIIVCWGIPFLLQDTKKGLLKYILCIIIAASIHNSTLFYFIFLFARRRYSKKDIRLVYVAVIALTLIMFLSFAVGVYAASFANPKIARWLDRSQESDILNAKGFLSQVFLVISVYYIVIKQGNILISAVYKSKKQICCVYFRKIQLIKNVALLLLFIIPGFAVAAIFYRLLLGVLPVFYVLFSDFDNCCDINESTRIKYRYLTLLIVILIALSYLYGNKGHDVFGTLKYNMLFM